MILGPKKMKLLTVSTFSPSICHEVMGPDSMTSFFVVVVVFQASFFSLLFPLHKWLFSSSSFYTIRVVSSANLRLLIFLLSIMVPACASFSLAFLMMYSAYKLNKQGDNIQH